MTAIVGQFTPARKLATLAERLIARPSFEKRIAISHPLAGKFAIRSLLYDYDDCPAEWTDEIFASLASLLNFVPLAHRKNTTSVDMRCIYPGDDDCSIVENWHLDFTPNRLIVPMIGAGTEFINKPLYGQLHRAAAINSTTGIRINGEDFDYTIEDAESLNGEEGQNIVLGLLDCPIPKRPRRTKLGEVLATVQDGKQFIAHRSPRSNKPRIILVLDNWHRRSRKPKANQT